MTLPARTSSREIRGANSVCGATSGTFATLVAPPDSGRPSPVTAEAGAAQVALNVGPESFWYAKATTMAFGSGTTPLTLNWVWALNGVTIWQKRRFCGESTTKQLSASE